MVLLKYLEATTALPTKKSLQPPMVQQSLPLFLFLFLLPPSTQRHQVPGCLSHGNMQAA